MVGRWVILLMMWSTCYSYLFRVRDIPKWTNNKQLTLMKSSPFDIGSLFVCEESLSLSTVELSKIIGPLVPSATLALFFVMLVNQSTEKQIASVEKQNVLNQDSTQKQIALSQDSTQKQIALSQEFTQKQIALSQDSIQKQIALSQEFTQKQIAAVEKQITVNKELNQESIRASEARIEAILMKFTQTFQDKNDNQ